MSSKHCLLNRYVEVKTENAYTKQFEINALRRNDYEVRNNLTLYKVSYMHRVWSLNFGRNSIEFA